MKNNAKYTALEILVEGFPSGEVMLDGKKFSIPETFGKYGIMIGGIRGIVDPKHLVSIPAESKILEVSIGSEFATIDLKEGSDEKFHSEASHAVTEERGKEQSEVIESENQESVDQ